ncbi:hypothetical protein NIES4075_62770 [Tolypothrix sp. NIES-4075]|uniref:Hsp70 family protein n=1 Tax=Tolypothrix sp. NIES-4075 TaxID=2005459 RepID=UPI000B5C9AAA|nr:Hsp70 family protein [Tolypothrix sp. NIES-4075]GAX45256.1 hypothetical protein NIES4075_62770 [Tolypothrix sp. NIES-4075]
MNLKKNQKIRVVVGIDFGTSRSGFAYSFSFESQIKLYRDWSLQPSPYVKTLTDIFWDLSKKQLKSWGWEAPEDMGKIPTAKINDYVHCRKFKMLLYEGKEYYSDKERILVLDLIASYLKEIKNTAFKQITTNTTGLLKEEEILWCLTVPTIWTNENKDMMRKAAVKAGLISESSADSERLKLALEPEAAALYCLEEAGFSSISDVPQGTSFMVVDAGGGTVDISVHKVVSDGLDTIGLSSGGSCGSTNIDREFLKYVTNLIGKDIMDDFHTKFPSEFLKLFQDWERQKCSYDEKSIESNRVLKISIPNKLHRIISEKRSSIYNKLSQLQEGDDEYICLKREKIEEIFKPTLDSLILLVDKQFQELDRRSNKCDYIFLVGGFATSPFLQERVKQRYESKKVQKVVIPHDPGAAVVWGSVAYAKNPTRIRSRCSRLTYGIETRMPFEDGDKEDKKWVNELGKEYCDNRFDIFVKARKIVKVGEKVKRKYYPSEKNQTGVSIDVYSTPEEDVYYIDEDHVTLECRIVVDMSDTTDGWNRAVEVSMDFGDTEIQVEAKNVNTGKLYNHKILFGVYYEN